MCHIPDVSIYRSKAKAMKPNLRKNELVVYVWDKE